MKPTELLLISTAAVLIALPIAQADLGDEVREAKAAVVQKEEQQRQILSALYQLNQKMRKSVSERALVDQKRQGAEFAARELAEKVLRQEEKLQVAKQQLRARFLSIFKMRGQNPLQILLNSKNAMQLDQNLRILSLVTKRDLQMSKDYSEALADLRQHERQFQKKLAQLKALESKVQSQEKVLAKENEHKAQILAQIRRTQTQSLAKLRKLRTKIGQSPTPEALLEQIGAPAFFEQKGFLPQPLSSTKVVSPYGLKQDHLHGVSWTQKGVVLAAERRSEIYCIFAGRISFVGELPGLGTTVIVDHGDHYYSVYGAGEKALVQVGQDVSAQQALALSGIHPDSGLTGLYFEIRHFSESENPTQWLKGIHL